MLVVGFRVFQWGHLFRNVYNYYEHGLRFKPDLGDRSPRDLTARVVLVGSRRQCQ